MGMWDRINKGFFGRKGDEVGSETEQSPDGLGYGISGGQGEKRPMPEDRPAPTPKGSALGPWQVGDVIRSDWGYTYSVREIKRGGMGQVYICIREDDMAPVVLKTIREDILNRSREFAIERFRWEAEVWVYLGQHKNIVRAYRTDTALGYPFIVLEYVPGDVHYGPELVGWIKKGGLSIDLAMDFAVQFCTGMIHAKEVFDRDPALKPPFVHQDIKPSNIMVTQNRVVKVTDFGLVKAFERGGVAGTLPYIAPEVWRGEELDERVDIYSFGCTLYEMFSGSRPFVYYPTDPEWSEKYRHAHLNLSPRPIPGIPDEINELVLQCLEKDRDRRYQDFEGMREALAGIYLQRTGERPTWREETEAEW